MAAGWKIREGIFRPEKISDDEIWQKMNFFYSDSSRKRNSYKYGLMKAILDNVFTMSFLGTGFYVSYDALFEMFTHNYWNLVIKYQLKQMRKDGRSEVSMIEKILLAYKQDTLGDSDIPFDAIYDADRKKIVAMVKSECKKYVLGAMYEDFDGYIYSFDLNGNGIYINPAFYEFFIKYKSEIEKINYYEWARFLESVNDDDALVRVIDKLELATPKREDLSLYRYVLEVEFEQHNCFYCGKKLMRDIHVDHFIPWSFVKTDVMWNFVLSCSTCNLRKNNKVPSVEALMKLKLRNCSLQEKVVNPIVIEHFSNYTENKLDRMWQYARMSGLRDFICK